MNFGDGHHISLGECERNYVRHKGDTAMKNIALVFALAFAFTTGAVALTVVAHTDRAMADSAGTVIVYPEQAPGCDGTSC
jgi:hypothetical protein